MCCKTAKYDVTQLTSLAKKAFPFFQLFDRPLARVLHLQRDQGRDQGEPVQGRGSEVDDRKDRLVACSCSINT